MKLRNEARYLRAKSLASMRFAMVAFNGFDEDGRATRVLLHLQHAFEMLLKAVHVQNGLPVFDRKSGKSIGFSKCVNLGGAAPLSLSVEEAGTLRTIDAMRDEEQHWYTVVDESILYLYTRAAVTLFDDLLYRGLQTRLADHLPTRVLPVGTEPPQDFQTLVDKEYANITDLLRPGRRARAEAGARIRTLLAMESQVDEDAEVSEADVRRVIRAIQEGKSRTAVFPNLSKVETSLSGGGITIEVRFSKKDGAPVQLITEDDSRDAAAIRLVPLQKKYHWGAFDLADKLGLSRPRATALRLHLGIDDDPNCVYTFSFGSQHLVRYSDNAYTRMRDALVRGADMETIWASHGTGRRRTPRPKCNQAGCAQQKAAS